VLRSALPEVEVLIKLGEGVLAGGADPRRGRIVYGE
jgi:hypothetical protein